MTWWGRWPFPKTPIMAFMPCAQRPVRELACQWGLLTDGELSALLNPAAMTGARG